MKNFSHSSFKLALLVILTSLIASSRPTHIGNAAVPEYHSSNQAAVIAVATPLTQALTPFPTLKQIPALAFPSTQAFSTADSTFALIEGSIRFAVIGDYGDNSAEEGYVADLVDSWNPDFVVTVGDNNYMDTLGGTIDDNIGQYYQQYISPYTCCYGAGSSTNRFFPSLGNHDLAADGGAAYFAYFTLPGNERYYDFEKGPVHFFVVNSDPSEPDGTSSTSVQGQWLQAGLAASIAPWQVVIFHNAAYSSGIRHGSATYMQWPFKDWGADAILTGHDHSYERLNVAGLPYFVNGMGGETHYLFKEPALPESLLRYNEDAGAMLVEASPTQIIFKFYTYMGTEIDSLTLGEPPTPVTYHIYIPILYAP